MNLCDPEIPSFHIPASGMCKLKNSNRITFHEHLAGWRRALSELHNRYKFILASSGGSTTLYGTYEECQDKAETDCRIITSKTAIARLDTILDAIKVLVEAQ